MSEDRKMSILAGTLASLAGDSFFFFVSPNRPFVPPKDGEERERKRTESENNWKLLIPKLFRIPYVPTVPYVSQTTTANRKKRFNLPTAKVPRYLCTYMYRRETGVLVTVLYPIVRDPDKPEPGRYYPFCPVSPAQSNSDSRKYIG